MLAAAPESRQHILAFSLLVVIIDIVVVIVVAAAAAAGAVGVAAGIVLAK